MSDLTLEQVREAGRPAFQVRKTPDGSQPTIKFRWRRWKMFFGGREIVWLFGQNKPIEDRRLWPRVGWQHEDSCDCEICRPDENHT